MTMVQYTAKVKGGLLLELPSEAQELHLQPGDELQVQLDLKDMPTPNATPNEKALAALREITRRQEGRRHTDGSQTERILREGRAGSMYGSDSVE